MSFERWQRLMSAFGLSGNQDTYASLVAAHAEDHRHYHTAEHIADCLRHLDEVADQASAPHEIELALWFHDAVYNPMSSTNEQDSADWAREFLRDNAASEDLIARVHALIMSTRHHGGMSSRDEELIVDIDLAILGADPDTYDRFEQAIRGEYRRVPWFLYRKKRKEILREFLDRETLYNTELFREKFAAQARINLANAIATL